MTTEGGAIPLGAEPASGGNYKATWSIRPGVRVHMLIPAQHYEAGALAELGDAVVDKLSAPHGQKIRNRTETP